VSGKLGRDGQPRQRTVLRHAPANVRQRVGYWRNSHLVRRLQSADVINQGLLFAAVLLLCFVPFLLIIESLAGRNNAAGLIRRFGLTGEAAHAVRQALTSPGAPSTAVSGLGWVFFIVGGIAAAAAIQELYERVFEVKGRGFRDTPQRVVWLVATLGVCLVGAWTQPWLDRAGGPGLVATAALPTATAFWWFSMWLLLAGKVGWRELFPSAVATGICWSGMVLVFRLTLSSTIVSNYRKYGSAGVIFAIMTLLIAIGVVIMLGALLGVVWRERREHPLGEQPDSSGERHGLAAATRSRSGHRRLLGLPRRPPHSLAGLPASGDRLTQPLRRTPSAVRAATSAAATPSQSASASALCAPRLATPRRTPADAAENAYGIATTRRSVPGS
jgi:membrane protein